MRQRFITLLVTAAASLVIVASPLFAHHGSAQFALGKRVTLTGSVTEWFWTNPHCLLSFDVKGDNGQVVH